MTPAAIPALSIRQPWAELILRGDKKVEVRNWSTPYRGPLWVHTGRGTAAGVEPGASAGSLFRGGYVGRVALDAIVPFDPERWELWRPYHLDPGDYRPGLYAWMLSSPVRLTEPIEAPGQLRLFLPPPELVEELTWALPAT